MIMVTDRGVFVIPSHLHQRSLVSLPLNLRVLNCLRRAGFDRLGQLHGVEVEKVQEIPNFGKLALIQLIDILQQQVDAGESQEAEPQGGACASLAREDLPGHCLQVPEGLHDVSIEAAPLNTRAYNCLFRAGIRSLGELDGMSEWSLLALPQFGKLALQSVREGIDKLVRGEVSPSQAEAPTPGQVPMAPRTFSSAVELLEHVGALRCPRTWGDRLRDVVGRRLVEGQTYKAIGEVHHVTGARIHSLVSPFLQTTKASPAWRHFADACRAAALAPLTTLEECRAEVSSALGWDAPFEADEASAFRILVALVPGLGCRTIGDLQLVVHESHEGENLLFTLGNHRASGVTLEALRSPGSTRNLPPEHRDRFDQLLARLLEQETKSRKGSRLTATEMIRQVLTDHPDRSLHFTRIFDLVGERFERRASELTLYRAILEMTPDVLARTSLGYYTLQEYAARLLGTQSGRRQLPDWYFQPWEKGVRLCLPGQSVNDRKAAFTWKITDRNENVEVLSARQVAGETQAGEYFVTSPGEWEVAFLADGEPVWREIVVLPDEPLVFSGKSGALTRDPSGEVTLLLPAGWTVSGGLDLEARPPLGEWDVFSARVASHAPLRFRSPEGSGWDGRRDLLFLGRRGLFDSGELRLEDALPVYTEWPDIDFKADWVGTVRVEGPGFETEFGSMDAEALARIPRRDGRYTLTLSGPGISARSVTFRLLRGLRLRRAANKKYAWMLELPANYQALVEEAIQIRPIGMAYELEVLRGHLTGRLSLRANGGADHVNLLFSPPQVSWRLNHPDSDRWSCERLDLTREDVEVGALWVDLRDVDKDSVLVLEEFDGTMLGLLPLQKGVRKAYHLNELSREGLHARSAFINLHMGGTFRTVGRLRQGWHPRDLRVEAGQLGDDGLSVTIQWVDEHSASNRSLILNSLSRPWEPPLSVEVPDGATEATCALPALGGYYEICAQSTEVDELDFFGDGSALIPGGQDIVYVFGDEAAVPLEGWAGQTAELIERYFMLAEQGSRKVEQLSGLRPPGDEAGAALLLEGCRRIQEWVPRDRDYAAQVKGLLDRTRWAIKVPYLRKLARIPDELVHWLAIPQLSTNDLDRISDLLGQPSRLLLDGEMASWEADRWLAAWRGTLLPIEDGGALELRIPAGGDDPLSAASRQLIGLWRQDRLSRYQMASWALDDEMVDHLKQQLAHHHLQGAYQFHDSTSRDLLPRFLFRLQAIACLCRHIGRHGLPIDSRLSRYTQQADRIAGPLLWMALSFWEVNGD